ncbi:MBOAT family protein [Candidatus Uabimicrobium sp. HlEnr_7]|uniref:MBOAT family O-acyltransferase n=1 Tax=Candidatus Uabimicrobium helgolandensis TaxID=3095367 RepID=UPI003558753E
MLFNSLSFIVFFVVFYTAYRLCNHKKQNILLLISSYIFYGWWDYRFLGIIVLSTAVDFYCAKALVKTTTNRKRYLWISILFNMGTLAFFKYYNFFCASLQELLHSIGIEPYFLHLEIVLPVGISFYTFQTMSYTIDVYNNKLKPSDNIVNFAVFVAYFPQLVAGPIERATRLLPQICSPRSINQEMITTGTKLIIWGFFKKIVIADNMAILVNQIFSMPYDSLHFFYILLGCYAFAFQIYGDFSGYSDIARGISKFMGINLMVNFRAPYFVKNPADFWRHWHISLSQWLRDYLYIPLGGNRLGNWRTKINLLATMMLGGLWHGASWNFLLWGLYQGILLMIWRGSSGEETKLKVLWQYFFTFHLICIGWLIFRVKSGEQLTAVFSALLNIDYSFLTYAIILKFMGVIFYALPICLEQYNKHLYDNELAFENHSILKKQVIYTFLLASIFFLAAPYGEDFIYFQF